MGQTTFSGPVKSNAGFQTGSSGTQITEITKGTVAVDPGSIAAGASADTDVTITGAASGDVVTIQPPADLTADLLQVGSWISASDTVTIRLLNNSGGPIDEGSANWSYTLFKS